MNFYTIFFYFVINGTSKENTQRELHAGVSRSAQTSNQAHLLQYNIRNIEGREVLYQVS